MPRRSNGKTNNFPADWLMAYRWLSSSQKHLIHAIRGKQSGVVRDRVRAIEVEIPVNHRFLQLPEAAGGDMATSVIHIS